MNKYDEYFEWLCDFVCGERFAKEISFRRLLVYLHNREFTYTLAMDSNRAQDGIDLRERYYGDPTIKGPCSVLEMMVALSIRCEEIMDNPAYGDRTTQWFWDMIINMGLGAMYDSRFDKKYVKECVDKMLNREYEPNGKGGLFYVRGCTDDLREFEIWSQMCYFLDSIT